MNVLSVVILQQLNMTDQWTVSVRVKVDGKTPLYIGNFHKNTLLQRVSIIKHLLDIKSNQITFIVTSPQHKCLGEWNSYERAPDSAKNKTQQFTYGQFIFTDCTEDNVQNTHSYTQYTQCTIKTYLVTNTHYTPYVHVCIMYTSIHSNMWRCNRL